MNNTKNKVLELIVDKDLYKTDFINNTESLMVTRYLFDISQYIILPIYSFIRLFVYSFDVIHTLGFYCWGIKIDAIPGRINLTTTLRLLWKGEYRGKCFELCGQGHLSMLITTLILLFYLILSIILISFWLIINCSINRYNKEAALPNNINWEENRNIYRIK